MPLQPDLGLGDVPRETLAKLQAFAAMVIEENDRQNLISSSTVDGVWRRHFADSAQLARLAPPGSWADVGSGAGFPGIVVACLVEDKVTLIEPRRLRAQFLERVVEKLGLRNASVQCARVERVTAKIDVVTARAVAPLHRLLAMAHHLSHRGTVWILPKGRQAHSELAEARRNWQCDVREVPSLTDPEATILVLTNVQPKRAQ